MRVAFVRGKENATLFINGTRVFAVDVAGAEATCSAAVSLSTGQTYYPGNCLTLVPRRGVSLVNKDNQFQTLQYVILTLTLHADKCAT